MPYELISENRAFDGVHRRYRHASTTLNCAMVFAVYLPPQALAGTQVPALYWLSGLSCTDENFMQKAGALKRAAQLGIALIAPDTSPRGADVPTDPDGAWDFGHGAGFYVNATQAPWARNYQMHDYVVHELPALIEANLPISAKRSIAGHSMGGHGALLCALRNPNRYLAVSAFAPLCNPSQTPWGQKALRRLLGEDPNLWREWDAVELLANASERLPILVDQGLADSFIVTELKPDALEQAALLASHPLKLRRHAHYDHSYYFIASFIDDHLQHHANALLV